MVRSKLLANCVWGQVVRFTDTEKKTRHYAIIYLGPFSSTAPTSEEYDAFFKEVGNSVQKGRYFRFRNKEMAMQAYTTAILKWGV